MACATSPDLEVAQDGDKMTFKLVSMMNTREITFTIGQEYEEKQHNDIMMKVNVWMLSRWKVITCLFQVMPELKDGKIVMRYTPTEEFKDKAKEQVHTREIDGDTLTLVSWYAYLPTIKHILCSVRMGHV